MKRFVFAFMFVLAFVGFAAATVSAEGPAKPVIEGEMPDCYKPIGNDGVTLFTNASVSDGGMLKYQWYSTDIENMTMIRAIDGAEGDSYQVPEELGVKWYCYAVRNVVGGLESEPTYSRLIRVEFYKNSSVHTHSFGEWMLTAKPTCTEAGIKARECDCGVTERAEVPAAGHNWDAGTITREPTSKADGEKTYSCLVCKATKTESVKYSGSLKGENDEKSSVNPDKDASTDNKGNHEKDTEQNSPEKSKMASFAWWIVAVAAVVTGAGVLGIVLILRNRSDSEKR